MEQRPSARQRIMDAALTVFSARGYTAAGVEEIAAAAGIKAPSLYKHFKNKRAIFDAILEDMEQRGDRQEDIMRAYLLAAAEEDGFFSLITEDVLVQKTQALVHRLLHDEYAGRFRRLLTIEQFSSAEFARLYTRRYMTELIDCHEVLFDRLMKRGLYRQGDARTMAVQYVSPICLYISLCDREPEREDEAMAAIAAHIRQFDRMYALRDTAREREDA